jgi:hypothetical protein
MKIKKLIKTTHKALKTTQKALLYMAESYEKFDKSQRYEMKAGCYNCNWQGSILVLKGLEKPEAIRNSACPNCKCKTLVYY